MIKLKGQIVFALMLSMAVVFVGCDDDDDPEIPNEEELITTLNYTLTSSSNGSTVSLKFVDLDGDGGVEPTITGGSLEANHTYVGLVGLLNESETPAENITEEILEEDLEHQFFFQSSISDLSVSYNDSDSEGNPLGLGTTISTGSPATGTLTVTLRHEPNKTASGVSDGDISNAGGETDIEVAFPIDVQ